MSSDKLILVTGAAGKVGSIGFKIVQLLRKKNIRVRAMVRQIDERSNELEKLGAEVVVGNLTNLEDLHKAINGISAIYFGMGVSDSYLEASLTTAAVCKHYGVEVFVNISQMTVSQMNIYQTTESMQQKYHWLVEQALNWSGLPVVHLRATIFLEHPFFTMFAKASIFKSSDIKLPFKNGKTSPIASLDVARVAAEVLVSPKGHIGKVYELTGPKSQDLNGIASEYSKALNREIKYTDLPLDDWKQNYLTKQNLPTHLVNHFQTMAKLHQENSYDRLTNDVEKVTGVKPMTIEDWVKCNHELFETSQS